MIEVKGVQRSVEKSARAAAFDLLAYRRAYETALRTSPGPMVSASHGVATLLPRQQPKSHSVLRTRSLRRWP
jgi:hypothetical protein